MHISSLTDTQSFIGECFSSFGEILQGMLPNGDHFLVTLPINVFSKTEFIPNEHTGIQVVPPSKTKTESFINKLKEHFGYTFSGVLKVESQIPVGKGLSSSTADMISALRAVENYLDLNFSDDEINQILRQIEPSDGLLYPGSVIYNYRKCKLILKLRSLPKLCIISIDQGGTLDTVSYNSTEKGFPEEIRREYAKLLDELIEAFNCQNLTKIGEIATASTLLNQRHNYKLYLDKVIEISKSVGSYGIVNTHSGTCLGLLIDPISIDKALARVCDQFNRESIQVYHTI